MLNFILIFIWYFLLTASLSKIAEKEQMESDWIAWFYLLFPPLYFLYITRRFHLMLLITVLTYWISNLLVMNWVPLKYALLVFFTPLILWFTFILHNLKVDQKFNLLNILLPGFWTIFLLIYLAFLQTPLEIDINKKMYEEKNKILNQINKKKKEKKEKKEKKIENNIFQNTNKNLFKWFNGLNYNTLNQKKYFWNNI